MRYWSSVERNTELPALAGYLLANRALWTALALAMLGATLALFKPLATGTASARKGAGAAPAPAAPGGVLAGRRAVPTPRYDARARLAMLARLWRADTLAALKGVPFLVLVVLGLANFVGGASFVDDFVGTKVYPVTHLMIEALSGSYTFLLVIVVAFYAGELAFRERAARLDQVVDATPMPDWLPPVAKFLALLAVIVVFLAAGAGAAMAFQLARGYTTLEPLLYAQSLALTAVPFVLMAALALALRVYANDKFRGYAAIVVVVVLQVGLAALDFEHKLYNYSSAPEAPYSDMNGFGHFLAGRLWFHAYWGWFAALLLAFAVAFRVRGADATGAARLAQARARLRGGLRPLVAALAAGFVGSGAFVFYNTNVLNEYASSEDRLDAAARYERDYAKYKDLPQPRIRAVRADVDIDPHALTLAIRGTYRLENPHPAPIAELHVQLPPPLELGVDFAPHELAHEDEELGYRIYRLREPLAPGATLEFRFTVAGAQRGFGNDAGQTQLVGNGTFFNNGQTMPTFGYNAGYQITDRTERRERGLGDVPRMARLEDEAARANHYLTDDADWIEFETTVSTSVDQVALAPGYLQREWVEGGRRYFRYAMDRPMLPFFAYLSASWRVHRTNWRDVAIEVYYDPKHPYNVERMIEGTRDSLDYFTEAFSPYQHRQVRIVEFPRYARFAQSFANTIPFSESIGFIADLRDPDALDYVYYVTAHEVAHQWWAHQVIGADVQGSTMLSESLAQYSALMVMERRYGPDKMRRFLKYELDRYLSSRGGELVEELPLYRVENQPYVHYRKGSLAFYRLKDAIGEDALNRALRKFLADEAYGAAPYPTSAELLAYLRAETPADRQELVTDLFERITFYDNRVVEATATTRADGRYDVTVTLNVGKVYVDGQGAETPAPLGVDDIELGVFARADGATENDETVLLLDRRRFTEARPTVTLTVDAPPYEVGIDPYNKLIDRVSTDNRKRVSL
jgi:hypothetical protein